MRTLIVSRFCLAAVLVLGVAIAAAGFSPSISSTGDRLLGGVCGGDCDDLTWENCQDINPGCCSNYNAGYCIWGSWGFCTQQTGACWGDASCRAEVTEDCGP